MLLLQLGEGGGGGGGRKDLCYDEQMLNGVGSKKDPSL